MGFGFLAIDMSLVWLIQASEKTRPAAYPHRCLSELFTAQERDILAMTSILGNMAPMPPMAAETTGPGAPCFGRRALKPG